MSEENKRNLGVFQKLTSSDFVDHADQEVRGPAKGVKWFHGGAYPEASPHAEVMGEKPLPLP